MLFSLQYLLYIALNERREWLCAQHLLVRAKEHNEKPQAEIEMGICEICL
jgi:hypothetical protein